LLISWLVSQSVGQLTEWEASR
jgi:hypothetical protein